VGSLVLFSKRCHIEGVWKQDTKTMIKYQKYEETYREERRSFFFSANVVSAGIIREWGERNWYHCLDVRVDSPWAHWEFSLTSFRPHYGPVVDPACNRNHYHLSFMGAGGGVGVLKRPLCVGLTAVPPSCGKCLEIMGASTSWSSKGLSGLYRDYFTLTFSFGCKINDTV